MSRILMLVTQPLDPDPRIDREAISLAKHGFSLRIVGLAEPRKRGYPERMAGITWRATKEHLDDRSFLFRLFRRGWTLAIAREIKFNLECFRHHARLVKGVSVVHCHDADTLPIGWLLSRMAGTKLVYDAHELYSGMFSSQVPHLVTKMVDAAERFFSRRAHLVITTGTLMGGRMKYVSGRIPLTLRNAPYRSFGMDVCRTETGRFTVGYVGALRKGRNIEQLVDAFEEFNRRYPDTVLLIAGWGELTQELRARASVSGSGIRFLGKIPESQVPQVLAELSLAVVFTSRNRLNHYYASSNKLWEAAAMGVPVLVTDIGELAYVVRRYELGWVVDSDSVESIAEKLTEIHSRSEELRPMALRAQEVFRTQICWDVVENALADAYLKLVAGPARFSQG